MKKKRFPFVYLIGIIVFVFLLFIIFFPSFVPQANVVIIPLSGVITMENAKDLFSETVSAHQIINDLKRAEENPQIKAVILQINSPGGSAVASDLITSTIKKMKKPVVAIIEEVGASGAYWIASAADFVIANRMSLTGSIGVLFSYLEFSQLMEKYGISYQRLVSGEYKDIGTPFRNLTDEERKLLENKLNKIHQFFIEEVTKNRNLDEERIKKISTGEFFLGIESYQLGLVDALGDLSTAESYLKEKHNLTEISYQRWERKPSFWELLFSTQTISALNLKEFPWLRS